MVEGSGFGCMPEHSGSCRDEIGSGIQDGSHYVTWQCEPVAERHYLLPQHPHKCLYRQRGIPLCPIVDQHIGSTASAAGLPHQLTVSLRICGNSSTILGYSSARFFAAA